MFKPNCMVDSSEQSSKCLERLLCTQGTSLVRTSLIEQLIFRKMSDYTEKILTFECIGQLLRFTNLFD
jgi:hypothetical protein